jgi:membrane protein
MAPVAPRLWGWSSVRRAFRELIGLYWESGVSADIPALAWYLLSSLAPLALGITALAALALGDYAEAQQLASRVSGVLPADAHEQFVSLILRTKRDSPLLIAGAIVGMLWTSSGVVGVIDRCLSRMLSRTETNPLLGKLHNIAVAFAVAVLIVLMVLLASVGTGVVHRLEVDSTLVRIAVPLVAMAIIGLICAAVFRVVSRGAGSWRSALIGGALSGVVLQVTPTAAGYYMRWVAGNTPVKAFLILTGVLITCYIIAAGLLLGAGVMARVQLGHRLGSPAGGLPYAATSAAGSTSTVRPG